MLSILLTVFHGVSGGADSLAGRGDRGHGCARRAAGMVSGVPVCGIVYCIVNSTMVNVADTIPLASVMARGVP